jgi:branched-chain amino acid transport system permease protein
LSLSLNLIMGYTGIAVLGMAAFMGTGAYTAAIVMTKLGFTFSPAMLLGVVVSFLTGMLIGMPTLRIKGNYLAMVTLGFGEIARIIELNWIKLTGGPFGIKKIPPPTIFGISHIFGYPLSKPTSKYFIILLFLVISIILVQNLLNSRHGRALQAIKNDEIAAQAMGINVFHYKLMGFAIAAALAGFAGAFFASYINYIDSSTFSFSQSIQILSMTIMGGLGSIPGSIAGAAFFVILPEFLRWLGTFVGEWVVQWRLVLYGILLILVIMYKPAGLLGGFDLNQVHLFNDLNHKKDLDSHKEIVG